jgi:hypothetical protein
MIALGLDDALGYANSAGPRASPRPPDRGVEPNAAHTAGRAFAPRVCVTTLRAAGHAVDCCHAEGHLVGTWVSHPLLTHANDPIPVVCITDVSDWFWASR